MIRNLKINEDAFYKLRQRKKILTEGKGCLTGYPSIDMPWLQYYTEEQIMNQIPNMSAYDFLKILNANNLNKTAINYKGAKISYLELFRNIEKTAKLLKRLNVKSDEIITIVLPPCPEEEYLLYAIDKIGACAKFVILGTPIESIVADMDQLNSTKLFIAEGIPYDKELVKSKTIIEVPLDVKKDIGESTKTNWEILIEECQEDLPATPNRNPNKCLFIAKTGGTTGEPKNVMISSSSFNNVANQYLNSALDYNSGDKWLRLWPIFHATSAISGNHLPLCAGMEIILDSEFNYQNIDELIFRHRPNHILLVPPLLEIIINSPLFENEDLSFIKTVGCGGAGMTPELEKRALQFFKKHNIETYLGCGYGLTENSSVATIRMSNETSHIGGTGVPLVNTIVSVFNPETNEEMKYYEEGEICINSDNFMEGYLNDETLSNQVIKTHKDGSKWIHTGDIGYMDDDGQVYINGRIVRTIFLHSAEKVYPNDLERKISTVDGVGEISVISIPDKFHDGFFVPACCIVPTIGYSEETVRKNVVEYCRETIPEYAFPRELFFIESIPLTHMAKPDIKKLEKIYK